MNKIALLALIDAIINDKIEANEEFREVIRGPRGYKGDRGRSFYFDEHEVEIRGQINEYVDGIKDTLKLSFSDLSQEEINQLKFTRNDFSDEDLLSLKGEKGRDGKKGKDFSWHEHEENISRKISDSIKENKGDLSLKFSDLSEDEKKEIQGQKGRDGKNGKDFSWHEHEEKIISNIFDSIKSFQSELKLNFSDLTFDEKQEIRGPRGYKGQKGSRGRDFNWEESKEDIYNQLKTLYSDNYDTLKLKFSDLTDDEVDSLKLKFNDLTEDELFRLKGSRGYKGQKGSRGEKGDRGEAGEKGDRGEAGNIGPMGLPGVMGQRGVKGEDGLDAPVVTDIELKKLGDDKIYFKFSFSNGNEISTKEVKLPSIHSYAYQYFSSSGVGGGSGGLASVETFKDGVKIGDSKQIEWIGDNIDVTWDAVNERTVVEILDQKGCIAILDESVEISSCVKTLDFKGDLVSADSLTKIADWSSLTEVIPSLGAFEVVSPGFTEITIDSPKDVNFISTDYVINDGTYFELTATGKIISLPITPIVGRKIHVTNFSGGDNIISGSGSNILGDSTVKIYDGESFMLMHNNIEWKVI